MIQTIRELFDSKKFVQALLGVAIAVAVRLGVPEIEVAEIVAIISPLLASIGAQGFADIGKERVIAEETIQRMNREDS
tara:strand:+ start:13353 stop:13586 length:234 start_codon:yes stop_codon:yes gene_type:complete